MEREKLEEFQNEVVELCEVYFERGEMTTSDFQGCLEGIINKYKETERGFIKKW